MVYYRLFVQLPAGRAARKHVKTGNIAKTILAVAEEEHSDIIIMGSRGLGLLKGVFIGSVSQKVIEESKIPVMVIK